MINMYVLNNRPPKYMKNKKKTLTELKGEIVQQS